MKIGLYADGSYFCKCVTCSEIFHGDKRAVQCLRCAAKQLQAELATAKKQILDYEQSEASVCPEDVGIKEYVANLQAEITTAKEENERLRELREELCLIIDRGVSVARPVAYHEILPWVRHAVAIARQHGLYERKAVVEQEALNPAKLATGLMVRDSNGKKVKA